jgi:uncharacterized protein
MLLPDVNVLIYAHRSEAPDHAAYAGWLRALATGPEPFALSELALVGFLRIVTNRRIYRDPSPPEVALEFIEELRGQPGCRLVGPGPRHWSLFSELYRATGAAGAFVADIHHAAVAIEHGCEWVSTDGDFARIPGLRWRHPLAPPPTG